MAPTDNFNVRKEPIFTYNKFFKAQSGQEKNKIKSTDESSA